MIIKLMILYRGLHKLMLKYWKFGVKETYRASLLRAQVKILQKYVPDIKLSDIERYFQIRIL